MEPSGDYVRHLPVGADVQPDGGVHFRVWAPDARNVTVVLGGTGAKSPRVKLTAEIDQPGMFAAFVESANTSTRYQFQLDSGTDLYPDPVSRFQPEGPHGPSQVVDPSTYEWGDRSWNGSSPDSQIIYEMHIGTFTREGTWNAAREQLLSLADLGVTLLEIMPIAEFPGRFGWGYDGVNLFAPTQLYGTPDDMRSFVDRAHSLGMGVILDVVYNHLGPDGNFLPRFATHYFSDRNKNDWGSSPNFDGDDSARVREYYVANATYWIREFHLDGLRLDATQAIIDTSPRHIIAEMSQAVREAACGRKTIIVAENEPQDTTLARPECDGGLGVDMLWNDDFHHSAAVALSGHNEAYYSDYYGTPQEFISSAKWGYLYQGQRYKWQEQCRGTSTLGMPPWAFVNFIQNHDQVANSARGLRCHVLTSPGRYRALTALMLLMPGTPMLFQGQEFAASTTFQYFADYTEQLRTAIWRGRTEFLRQFPSLCVPEIEAQISDPSNPRTFEGSKLILEERERHSEAYVLHRELIWLRRNDPVLRSPQRGNFDGAVLGPEAFAIRFFGGEQPDRLLIVNLGRDLVLDVMPEPLMAAPRGMKWQVHWSSEDLRFGGLGTVAPETAQGWRLTGQATVLMIATPKD